MLGLLRYGPQVINFGVAAACFTAAHPIGAVGIAVVATYTVYQLANVMKNVVVATAPALVIPPFLQYIKNNAIMLLILVKLHYLNGVLQQVTCCKKYLVF